MNFAIITLLSTLALSKADNNINLSQLEFQQNLQIHETLDSNIGHCNNDIDCLDYFDEGKYYCHDKSCSTIKFAKITFDRNIIEIERRFLQDNQNKTQDSQNQTYSLQNNTNYTIMTTNSNNKLNSPGIVIGGSIALFLLFVIVSIWILLCYCQNTPCYPYVVLVLCICCPKYRQMKINTRKIPNKKTESTKALQVAGYLPNYYMNGHVNLDFQIDIQVDSANNREENRAPDAESPIQTAGPTEEQFDRIEQEDNGPRLDLEKVQNNSQETEFSEDNTK